MSTLGAGAIGEDKVFVVSFGDEPSLLIPFLVNKFPTGDGVGATVDDVAVDDNNIGLPCFEVVGDGVESRDVAVYIGDDCKFHKGAV